MDVKVGASIGVVVWLVTWLGEAKLEEYVTGSGLNGELVILSLCETSETSFRDPPSSFDFQSTHSFSIYVQVHS